MSFPTILLIVFLVVFGIVGACIYFGGDDV